MSKRIFFLTPYPHGEAPSQRFRFEQYFEYLRDSGFEIEQYPFLDDKTWKTLYAEGKIFRKILGVLRSFARRKLLLFKLRKADYIFIHREAAHLGPPFYEWFIAKVLRRKYIYDFDDAIWLPNYSETNARFHRLKAYWKVKYCIKWAHQVSAGNQYLADYALKYNKNIRVIPTTIDTEGHHNILCDHTSVPVTIGWTGTHTTMHYLNEIIPVLETLEQKYNFKLIVISNEKPSFELKSLEFIKWKKETEIQDLARIQIGIMPLRHDIWSEGKCGFKGLQYMSLGMATIMSPVGVNTQIIQDGENGFIASTQVEWKEKLELLLNDQNLRENLGKAGRKTILEKYSVIANQKNYLELFNS